jgi:hypothetical protein
MTSTLITIYDIVVTKYFNFGICCFMFYLLSLNPIVLIKSSAVVFLL